MAARRAMAGAKSLDPMDAHMEAFYRMLTPWLVWLAGVPAACLAFRILAVASGHPATVGGALAAAAAGLALFARHMGRMRSAAGRHHHALNTFCSVGLVAAVAWAGPVMPLVVVWAVAGLAGSIAWNIRTAKHDDGVHDVLSAKPQRAKLVDGAWVIRSMAGKAPVIRATAEHIGNVVPAAVAPFRQPAVTTSDQPAIEGRPVAPADLKAAFARAQAIRKNWADLTTKKHPDLAGARMTVRDVKPWRVKTIIHLVRGVQVPKAVIGVREEMASQCALPLSSIIATVNRKRHDQVFMDFVLEDVLKDAVTWPGPAAVGQSVAAAPCRIGLYEDRRPAERFGPAITTAMAKTLGRGEKNLSHLLIEGVNGSGKSTWSRVQVADAATRCDVEEWLVDTVKRFQTFGPLGRAFSWFATTPDEARKMVRFLAKAVIPERANYLGLHGFDNWEPGCGLPYLRLTVEEGGVIAAELEQLTDVLMTARSAGVEVDFSIQRAHHALLDTNVRAQFGESASFGVKNLDDAFALPDELADAGADPAQWGNRQPGMCYWASSELDLDRQIIPVRGFNIDLGAATSVVNEHVPAREAWIAEHCPDWAKMLERLDVNGAWAKRTTGAAVYAQIEKAQRKRDGQDYDEVVAVPVPAPAAAPQPQAALTGVIAMNYDDTDDDEQEPVTMDEIGDAMADEAGHDQEILDSIRDDDRERIDPRQTLPPVRPDQEFRFPRPESSMTREQSLSVLRSWLTGKGDGFEFAPRDIYDDEDLMAQIGRTAGWIRSEISTTLRAEGVVEQTLELRAEGRYRVRGPRMRLVPSLAAGGDGEVI